MRRSKRLRQTTSHKCQRLHTTGVVYVNRSHDQPPSRSVFGSGLPPLRSTLCCFPPGTRGSPRGSSTSRRRSPASSLMRDRLTRDSSPSNAAGDVSRVAARSRARTRGTRPRTHRTSARGVRRVQTLAERRETAMMRPCSTDSPLPGLYEHLSTVGPIPGDDGPNDSVRPSSGQ